MNNDIPHSDPNSPSNTKDGTDLGVPMRPQAPTDAQRQGPEDAADNNAGNRGDYSKRVLDEGFTSEPIPESERVPGGPISRMVSQRPPAAPGAEAGTTGGV